MSADKSSPEIKALTAVVVDAEKKVAQARKRVTELTVEGLQTAAITETRQRLAKLDVEIRIKQDIAVKLKQERDTVQKLLNDRAAGGMNVTEMRQALEPQREMLAKVNRELQRLRVQSAGVTLSEATETDAKLDAILRELAALRKEVRELKEQKK